MINQDNSEDFIIESPFYKAGMITFALFGMLYFLLSIIWH